MKYFVMILVLLSSFNASADEFTRSLEIPPLSMTNEKVIKSVNELYNHVKSINGNENATEGYLTLGKDDVGTNLPLPIDNKDISKFPQISYEAYSKISSYKGKIKEVTISFSDRSRKITSIGSDHDFVLGVLNVGKEKFYPYITNLTGPKMRVALWLSSLFVFLVLSFIGLKTMKEKIYWPLYTIGLIMLLSLQLIPSWELYFPGFLVSVDERGFLEKYSAIISFIGLLASLIIPFVSFILSRHKANNQMSN